MKIRAYLRTALVAFWASSGLFGSSSDAASLRDKMIEQAKQEGEFVIGGSNADNFRDELKGFGERYPFLTIKAFTANTGDTINRVVAEAKAGRPSIDLVATSSDGAELLAQAGVLAEHDYPHLRDFVPGLQPEHGLYVAAFLNPRVQGIYNTDLVAPKDAPKSWADMVDPKWTGKVMLSRSSEDIPAQLAYLWAKDGKPAWERSFDFFRKLAAQNPLIARGYRGGTKRIASGEAAIFWFTSVGPAARLHFSGASIGVIAFPRYTGTFRSYAVTKGARHPAGAWLFTDYLTSPEGQFEYTEIISAKVALNKKAKNGKLGQWLVDEGVKAEDTVPLDAQVVMSKDTQKKSEDFFLELLGVR